jgi:hypothetical protein
MKPGVARKWRKIPRGETFTLPCLRIFHRSKSGANPAAQASNVAALYPVVATSPHAPMVGPYASVDGAGAGKSSGWGLRDALLSSWYQEPYTIL